MKKYISKKNNTNKKNKQTLKKTIKKTKKNNVLHGGSSYFLNLIKKNVYLSKLGSGAQYIKNSAMAGLAKGAQYVAETRVGKSVKTKVVSAFTSKEAYDFYDTIAAYILKKPKEHTKLIMNKVIKKTNSKPLTLDNLYQFFNVAKIDINIDIDLTRPRSRNVNYISMNREFNRMTNINTLCLQYYKHNLAKPLMTIHKLLLSTYFNLNNLNTYMKTIKDIIDIETMTQIFDIFDDIINIHPHLKFKDLFENIIASQNITFENIDYLVLFFIIIINSKNEVDKNGKISIIKLINYILDIMIQIYYKDTFYRRDFEGDGSDRKEYDNLPAFTWLLNYLKEISEILTIFKSGMKIEDYINTDFIINIFGVKGYKNIILWLKDFKETMDEINRTERTNNTEMDLQKYLIFKFREFQEEYTYINFGFLINLITKKTDTERQKIYDFLWKLLDTRFSVVVSPEEAIRNQERRRARAENNNSTFTKVKIDKKLFSNDVKWNNFKDYFTVHNPTLFDVINNEDNHYVILPYVLSSISIFGDDKVIDIATSNIIINNMNSIFGELYNEKCDLITTENSGRVKTSHKSSTSTGLGFFNSFKTSLKKITSLVSFGASGFTDICENLHSNNKQITNANIKTFDTFLSYLLSSTLVHMKTNVFKDNKLIISHVRQLFIYYTIKSNIDTYIDNLLNDILQYLYEKSFNLPISKPTIPTMLRGIFEIQYDDTFTYSPEVKYNAQYPNEINNTHIIELLSEIMAYIQHNDNDNDNRNAHNNTLNGADFAKLMNYFLIYYEILNIWFLIFKTNKDNEHIITTTTNIFDTYDYTKDYNKKLLPIHKLNDAFIPTFFEYNILISSPIIENLLEVKIKHMKNSNYILYKNNVHIFRNSRIIMTELQPDEDNNAFVNVSIRGDSR